MATVGAGARWIVWYLVTGEEDLRLELTDPEADQILDLVLSLYGQDLVEAVEAELGAGTVRVAQTRRSGRDFAYELEILEAVDDSALLAAIPERDSYVHDPFVTFSSSSSYAFNLFRQEAREIEGAPTFSPPPPETETDPMSSCGSCGPLSTDGPGTGGGGGGGGPFDPTDPGISPGPGESSPDGGGGFLQELGDAFSLEALEGDRFRLSTPWGEWVFSRNLLWVLLALLVLLLLISR